MPAERCPLSQGLAQSEGPWRERRSTSQATMVAEPLPTRLPAGYRAHRGLAPRVGSPERRQLARRHARLLKCRSACPGKTRRDFAGFPVFDVVQTPTLWQRRVGRLVQGPVLARRAAGPGGDARADRHGEGRRGRMHPFLRPCLPGLHAANQDVRAVPVLIRSGIFEGGRESCCVGRLYPSGSSWLRPQRPPDARCASHPPRRAERPGAEPGAGERLGVGAVQRVLTGDDVADPGSRSKQAARRRE